MKSFEELLARDPNPPFEEWSILLSRPTRIALEDYMEVSSIHNIRSIFMNDETMIGDEPMKDFPKRDIEVLKIILLAARKHEGRVAKVVPNTSDAPLFAITLADDDEPMGKVHVEEFEIVQYHGQMYILKFDDGDIFLCRKLVQSAEGNIWLHDIFSGKCPDNVDEKIQKPFGTMMKRWQEQLQEKKGKGWKPPALTSYYLEIPDYSQADDFRFHRESAALPPIRMIMMQSDRYSKARDDMVKFTVKYEDGSQKKNVELGTNWFHVFFDLKFTDGTSQRVYYDQLPASFKSYLRHQAEDELGSAKAANEAVAKAEEKAAKARERRNTVKLDARKNKSYDAKTNPSVAEL